MTNTTENRKWVESVQCSTPDYDFTVDSRTHIRLTPSNVHGRYDVYFICHGVPCRVQWERTVGVGYYPTPGVRPRQGRRAVTCRRRNRRPRWSWSDTESGRIVRCYGSVKPRVHSHFPQRAPDAVTRQRRWVGTRKAPARPRPRPNLVKKLESKGQSRWVGSVERPIGPYWRKWRSPQPRG